MFAWLGLTLLDIFSASALVSGISQPMAVSRESERLRDRLVSDLSGHDIKKDVEKGCDPHTTQIRKPLTGG